MTARMPVVARLKLGGKDLGTSKQMAAILIRPEVVQAVRYLDAPSTINNASRAWRNLAPKMLLIANTSLTSDSQVLFM